MSTDDKRPALTLINTPTEVPPRNYWNTAGAGKEYFPAEPRANSVPTLNKAGRVITEPEDEWWINSKEDHYCFWEYVRKNSQPDGTMEPLLQSEIAELFGCSSTKVHFMLKEAMDRLTTDENMQILQDMFELCIEEPSDEPIHMEAAGQLEEPDEDTEA